MRKENWDSALNDVIDSARNAPFEWGKSDCALFVADCVIAITGKDWAAPFRGHYKTAKGSLVALKKYGQGSLEKTLNAHFEQHETNHHARRGDVVLLVDKVGSCLGICVGTQAVFRAPDGITFMPLSHCKCAWIIN